MTMIDTADSRFAKAIAIADQAGQWLKVRTVEGRKAYGIRSSRDANHIYFVTQLTCDCEDARRHPGQLCKHRLAVQIHCARAASKPLPASDVVDGLSELVRQRVAKYDQIFSEPEDRFWNRFEDDDAKRAKERDAMSRL